SDLPREDQLLLEPLQRRRRLRQVSTDRLQRDGAIQLAIPRLIYGSHAAFTQLAHDLVAASENSSYFERRDRWALRIWRLQRCSRPCCPAIAGDGRAQKFRVNLFGVSVFHDAELMPAGDVQC